MRHETVISENYLPHWTAVSAVKEFIQNLVFAKSILGDDITIEHDGTCAIIHNSPSGFSKGKLLMGESEQRDTAGSPGYWGEGIKVGMMIARRLGLECHFATNGFTVYPELEPSILDPNVRVLTYHIEDTDDNHGTTFIIQCSKEELDEATSYFAILNNVSEELTKKDGIIDGMQNTIFVNGVKVYEHPSVFSYNFTDASLINRDRSSVDIRLVRQQIRRVMSALSEPTQIDALLHGITTNHETLEAQAGLDSWSVGNTKSIWKTAGCQVFGTKCCLATGGDSDTLARYKGFKVLTNVPDVWESFFSHILGIKYSNELEATRPKNVSMKPKGDKSATLGWAKRLVSLYYADYGTVKIAKTVVNDFGDERPAIYDRMNDVIWIKEDLLDSKEATFKALLHETVHRETGASDNTEEFTMGWEQACWGILNRKKMPKGGSMISMLQYAEED